MQFPVFTDNSTIFGDGTEEHPLNLTGGSSDEFQIVTDGGQLVLSMNGSISGAGAIQISNSDTTNASGITIEDDSGGGLELLNGFPGGDIVIGGDSAETNITIGIVGDKLGFFGQVPAAQPVAPTTLPEVIALLHTLGLSA